MKIGKIDKIIKLVLRMIRISFAKQELALAEEVHGVLNVTAHDVKDVFVAGPDLQSHLVLLQLALCVAS